MLIRSFGVFKTYRVPVYMLFTVKIAATTDLTPSSVHALLTALTISGGIEFPHLDVPISQSADRMCSLSFDHPLHNMSSCRRVAEAYWAADHFFRLHRCSAAPGTLLVFLWPMGVTPARVGHVAAPPRSSITSSL